MTNTCTQTPPPIDRQNCLSHTSATYNIPYQPPHFTHRAQHFVWLPRIKRERATTMRSKAISTLYLTQARNTSSLPRRLHTHFSCTLTAQMKHLQLNTRPCRFTHLYTRHKWVHYNPIRNIVKCALSFQKIYDIYHVYWTKWQEATTRYAHAKTIYAPPPYSHRTI